MHTNELGTSKEFPVANGQIVASMGQIDRREWWLWSSAISVMFLMAIGIASFALPTVLSDFDSFHAFLLDHAARALSVFVLIFSIYVVYEQMQINRIRQEFADKLYEMAVLDPVTNMFNRRYIIERLNQEIARCERQASPLTVIAIDLDGFKQINDDCGHAGGDYILRVFGEQLRRATRGSDIVARYGGDEFLAILPNCNSEQTQLVLSRLNGISVKITNSKISIRYSAGWTNYIPGESLNDLLKRADDMLYANKRNPTGRYVSTIVGE